MKSVQSPALALILAISPIAGAITPATPSQLGVSGSGYVHSNLVQDSVYHPETDGAKVITAQMSEVEISKIREYVEMIQDARDDQSVLQPPQEPDVKFDPSVLNDPNNPYRQEFDLVVLINKAPHAETIDVFRFGQWIKHGRVSTALEHQVPDTRGGVMFATTPTGYFTPEMWDLSPDHHSSLFENARMRYAAFYNDGRATHQAPPGTEGQLGHRASHGCVRNTELNASDIFWLVALSGGPFKPADFTAWCRLSTQEKDALTAAYPNDPKKAILAAQAQRKQDCKADQTWNAITAVYQRQAQRALDLGASQAGNAPQALPYQAWPQVPDVNSDTGEYVLDPATNQPKRHAGYRTLYIVENIEPAKHAKPVVGPTTPVITDPSQLFSAYPRNAIENQEPHFSLLGVADSYNNAPVYNAPGFFNPRNNYRQQNNQPFGGFFNGFFH